MTELLMDPWEEAQAARTPATPPIQTPTMDPWEEARAAQGLGPPSASSGMTEQGAPVLSSTTPSGYPEPIFSDNPPAGAEVPYGQKVMNRLQKVGEGMGVGTLGAAGVSGLAGKAGKAYEGVTSLFETPESLKSAGITTTTLQHMAPMGQNPADYANAVETQLQGKGVLAKTAKDTWDLMNSEKAKVGRSIGDFYQKVAAEAAKYGDIENPLVVDAQSALQPLVKESAKRAGGLFSATQNTATPFQQAYEGLMNMAKQQGDKLGLDNIEAALQETGNMMDEGGEAAEAIFGKLYGKLADVRDLMVNTVAQQAKTMNPELAEDVQTFLKNNADYSTYMRLLPSVTKAGFKEAIREGVSAYRKYGGPLVTKGLAVYGIGKSIQEGIGKFLGH